MDHRQFEITLPTPRLFA